MRRVVCLLAALLTLGCHRTPLEVETKGSSASGQATRNLEAAPAPPESPPRETAPSAAEAAPRTPVPKRIYRAAALGDSITDERVGGGGYLRYLRKACPLSTFDDFGRGGDMTNQMKSRLTRDLLPRAQEYDTLIVYGGVNDLYSNLTAGRTNDRIEADLSAIFEAAREAGLRVVSVTVSPWGGFRRYFNEDRSRNTRLLNAWLLGEATGGKVDVVVDSYPLLSCGNPEVLCPDYETAAHDGLHPGPRGHELLGQALLERAFSDCR